MKKTLGNKERDPKRFHLRFFDTKIIWEFFSSKEAAMSYLFGINFIKSELEVYDSKNKKVVYCFEK